MLQLLLFLLGTDGNVKGLLLLPSRGLATTTSAPLRTIKFMSTKVRHRCSGREAREESTAGKEHRLRTTIPSVSCTASAATRQRCADRRLPPKLVRPAARVEPRPQPRARRARQLARLVVRLVGLV